MYKILLSKVIKILIIFLVVWLLPFRGSGNRSKGYVVRIRRSRFVEDGISAFTKAKCRDLKDRLVIRYINDFGEEEMGIDSGGLFKDFINDLGGRIFGIYTYMFIET